MLASIRFLRVLFLPNMLEAGHIVMSAKLLMIWFDDDLHVGTITKSSSTICVASSHFFIEGTQIICLALLVGPLIIEEVQKGKAYQKVNEVDIETFINWLY